MPMIALVAGTLGACGSGCGTRCKNAGPSALRVSPVTHASPASPASPAPATTAAVTGSAGAQDLAAESLTRTAQTAAETLATDDNGNYSRISPKAIAMLEPNIPLMPNRRPYLSAAHGTATTYSVTVTSPSGDTFTITRNARGHIARTCAGHASSLCHGGSW
jgi:hypothetical protein